MDVTDRLSAGGIIPVLSIPDPSLAPPVAEALLQGGVSCVEVAFRTAAAAAALLVLRQQYPELFVGAGTVLTSHQADIAMDAGAQFIVAPGTNAGVIDHVVSLGLPMIPGVATPSDVEAVLTHGIALMKFFPAEQFGGLATIRAFAGPYPKVRYVPTGGISPANLGNYLAAPEVVACGGSWIVRPDLVATRDFGAIAELARQAVEIVSAARQA